MEEVFRLDPTSPCSNDIVRAESFSCNFGTYESNEFHGPVDDLFQFEAGNHYTQDSGSDMCDIMKTQIANHPRYPDLLSAYIECQKVGTPPELACVLEEKSREKYTDTFSAQIGADPELDEFMESYTEILRRYKEELSKPFNEATIFLNEIGSQLNSLCEGVFSISHDDGSDEAAGTSDEEFSGGEVEEASESQEYSGGSHLQFHDDQDLKGMLMSKYSGYLSSLRKEFLKKRKKGKLPKDARRALLNWWHHHHQWPYPTEDDKGKLSEMTGLDQKQINNWFINQRKRHWKPSEDMMLALMESVGQGGFTAVIGQPASSSTYFVTTGGRAEHVIVKTP